MGFPESISSLLSFYKHELMTRRDELENEIQELEVEHAEILAAAEEKWSDRAELEADRLFQG